MKIKDDEVPSIVGKIAAKFDPQMIVLFGSLARGSAKDAGDIDLLVVMRSGKSSSDQAREIDMFFWDRDFPLDILVYSPEEVEAFKQVPGSLISEILDHGKVLYDRAA